MTDHLTHGTEFVKTKKIFEDASETLANADEEDDEDAPPAPYIDETISRIKTQLAELRSCMYILALSVAGLAGGVIALARR